MLGKATVLCIGYIAQRCFPDALCQNLGRGFEKPDSSVGRAVGSWRTHRYRWGSESLNTGVCLTFKICNRMPIEAPRKWIEPGVRREIPVEEFQPGVENCCDGTGCLWETRIPNRLIGLNRDIGGNAASLGSPLNQPPVNSQIPSVSI